MKIVKSVIIGVSGIAAFLTAATVEAAQEMPVEAFAALPSLSSAKLSPTGNSIAYTVNQDGRRAVIYQNLDGSGAGILPPPADAEISQFFWATDDVLLVETNTLARRSAFVQKVDLTRVMSFSRKNGKFTWLGKPKKQKRHSKFEGTAGREFYSQYERIVDFLSDDPNHILLQLDFDLDGNPDVFKVNIKSGKRKKVRGEYRGIQNWYTDHNSVVRAGFGYDGDKVFGMIANAEGNWNTINRLEWTDMFDFMGFSSAPNIAYVSGNSKHGTNGVYKLDINTGDVLEEIFSHPKVDIDGVIEHPVTGHVAGVVYRDDFTHTKYFDKSLRIVQRSIDKALKGSVNTIVGKARDKDLYLFYVTNAENPGDYYIFDRKQGQLTYFAPQREQINIERTASTSKHMIPVRDGTEIPGYITVPKGKEPKNLPAIILPHGGPYSGHDNAEWDYWAQFYANRGYLVLKPNFRGTLGYGDAFYLKGVKQWGGLMQDDVTDATKWLIAEGMVDPKRICIVGASYGGYAALMGVVKEPELYRCAISVNGVPNIPAIKADDKEVIGGSNWIKNMGLEGTKDTNVSPYHRAKEIQVPVMLISSKDDARVPYGMSISMHQKLQKHKKDSTYVQLENGGHSMVTDAARLKMLKETEKFLKTHIGKTAKTASGGRSGSKSN